MLRLEPTLDRPGGRGRERCGVFNRDDGYDFEVLSLGSFHEVDERATRWVAEHQGVFEVVAKVAPELYGLAPVVLSDPTIRVVDARSDKDFSSGHIPAAVNINGFSLGGIRPGSEMPKPEAFAHLVGPLGIDEHTPVVVYD